MAKTVTFDGHSQPGGFGDERQKCTVVIDQIVAIRESDTMGCYVLCNGGFEFPIAREAVPKLKEILNKPSGEG